MKVKLEIEKELISKVEDITRTDYLLGEENITVENLESMLKDMIYEYNCLKEEYEDYKRNVDENYTQNENDYGVSDREFF